MREKIKRLLSLLLALSMLIGTILTDSGFGVTVYAAPPTDQQPEATKNVQVSLTNLTKVGNVSFGNVAGTLTEKTDQTVPTTYQGTYSAEKNALIFEAVSYGTYTLTISMDNYSVTGSQEIVVDATGDSVLSVDATGFTLTPSYSLDQIEFDNKPLTVGENKSYTITGNGTHPEVWLECTNKNPDVATVILENNTITVSALKAGSAEITVKTRDNTKSATITVTVNKVTVTIAPKSVTPVMWGEVVSLPDLFDIDVSNAKSSVVYDVDGKSFANNEWEPEDATDHTITAKINADDPVYAQTVATLQYTPKKRNVSIINFKALPVVAQWGTEITVSAELKDKDGKTDIADNSSSEIKYYVDNTLLQGNKWIPPMGKEYTLTARFYGNDLYNAIDDKETPDNTIKYTPGKHEQQFTIKDEKGIIIDTDNTDGKVDTVELTYGDSGKIFTLGDEKPVDKKDNKNPASKTYSVTVDNRQIVDVTINDKKEITIKPVNAGSTVITITQVENEHYNSSSQVIPVTVKPYELKLSEIYFDSTDKKEYDNKKTFNGNNDVNVWLTVDKSELPATIKDDTDIEDLYMENFQLFKNGQKVIAVCRDEKNDVKPWKMIISYEDISKNLIKELPANYKLQEGGEISGELTIEPATLKLHINDAKRSLRESNDKLEFKGKKYFAENEKIRATGFWHEGKAVPDSNEMEGFSLPKGIVYPEVKTDLEQFSATSILHENVLYAVKGDKDNATNNYEFDYERTTQDQGAITIEPEEITDFTEYISINNEKSKNVCQPKTENAVIYFGKGANAKFVFKNPDDIYTKIWEVTEETVDVTGEEGSKFKDEEFEHTSVTKKYYLSDASQTICSKPFEITYTRDQGVPKATISIRENDLTLEGFVDAITFGAYNNVKLEADIKVTDYLCEDCPAESGVKEWGYAVVEADEKYKAKVFKEDEDIKNLNYNDEGNTEGRVVPIPPDEIGGKNGHYLVFVKVTDMVGNTGIYGSNGMVIENIPLSSTTVEYDKNTTSEKDYFNSSIGLDITAYEDTTKDFYSGVQSLSYTATIDDEKSSENVLVNNSAPVNKKLDDLKQEYETQTGHVTVVIGENGEKESIQTDTITIEDGTSRIIQVDAHATDFAGNQENDTGSKKFVIDRLAPVIKNSISSEAKPKNGMYYNKDVVITTEITERFLDIYTDVIYTISIDKGAPEEITLGDLITKKDSYGILSIEKNHDAEETREDTTVSTITITFEKEHEYVVTSSVKDKAGNPQKSDPETYNFVIDKTNPEAIITYYPSEKAGTSSSFTDANQRVYLNNQYNSFEAIVSVTELNFADTEGKVDGRLQIVAKDSANKNVLADVISSFMENSKKKENWSNQGENVRWFRMNMTNDANYTFDFSYTDLAGNPLKTAVNTGNVTLDRVAPTGSITVDGLVNSESSVKTWISQFINKITFGLFGKNGMGATTTSEDITAGVVSNKYFIAANGYTKEQLDSLDNSQWKDYKGRVSLQANQNAIVYQRIEDAAGNYEFYSTENLVADNQDPAPVVHITPSSPGWGKGVYSAGDNPGFDITVEDPVNNNSYSGLKTITYTIKNGTTGAVETGTLANIGRNEHRQSWKGHVNIDPSKFYSNDVQVVVEASDWSTNEAVSETAKLKVDNKAPVVTFAFDKSDAMNTKYYKNNKTLTITVDERNFDTTYIPKVTSTAGGGYSFSGWSTNGEKTTGVITFSGDSDFTVTYDCYDLAGNKSNTENLEEFTVDKTIPTISVSYDNDNAQNGNYYKASRIATITINEHNFNAGDVKVTTTASNGRTPGVSGWSGSGDRHTATVEFDSDADYTFDISYIDMAGNSAAEYDQDRFTVDLTKPSMEITGVANKSANKGTVAPVITVSDTNYIASGVTISLTGANRGKVDTSSMVSRTNSENGQIITFRNFGSNMDDIYTLVAKSVDKAGNETTQSITFSVNRDGSAYNINQSTKDLIEKGFTNNPQDIVIEEVNVDTLEFIEISYSKDGKIVKLTEGKDYKVEAEGGEGQWKKYTYTIFAKCFNEEGEYSINISSTDRAENISNNKVQSVNVDFVVDMTAPIMAVSNLENRGRYKENRHEYTLNVKDNTMLTMVQIYLDDKLFKTYEVVDGKLVNIEDPSDVLEIENGKVYLGIDSKNMYQKIKLVSTDAAGNVSETEDYNVLVTSSNLVQFYMNKPLFYGSIIAVIAACGIIIFLILKKKRA